MKTVFVLLMASCLISMAAAHFEVQLRHEHSEHHAHHAHHAHREHKAHHHPLCNVCISLSSQVLSQVLSIASNVGILGSCSKVCSHLGKSKLEHTACNVLCDAVGITTFVSALKRFSGYLDPIFFCEEVHACPINDNYDVKTDGVVLSNPKGDYKMNTPIVGEFNFEITNSTAPTGTGEMLVTISKENDKKFMPQTNIQPFFDLPAGKISMNFNILTGIDAQKQGGLTYPGDYKITLEICDGICQSKLPHNSVKAIESASFTLSK